MYSRYLDARRPDSWSDSSGTRFGDYPVALVTRRTMSLCCADVLAARGTSPGSVLYVGGHRPRSTYPC